jgi:hypothetical protein
LAACQLPFTGSFIKLEVAGGEGEKMDWTWVKVAVALTPIPVVAAFWLADNGAMPLLEGLVFSAACLYGGMLLGAAAAKIEAKLRKRYG